MVHSTRNTGPRVFDNGSLSIYHYAGFSAVNPTAYQGTSPFYTYAGADWKVPPIHLVESSDLRENMTFWVGLRSCTSSRSNCITPNSSGVLFQTGITSDIENSGNGMTTLVFPFFEWLNWNSNCTSYVPNTLTLRNTNPCDAQIQPYMNVTANDEIYASVWIGDGNGNITGGGQFAYYFVEDISNNGATATGSYYMNPAGSWGLNGYDADWILERPARDASTNPPAMYNLVKFDTFTASATAMWTDGPNAGYGGRWSGNYSAVPNWVEWQMVDQNRPLATVAGGSSGSATMTFTWHHDR
jgi:hypothetical protein